MEKRPEVAKWEGRARLPSKLNLIIHAITTTLETDMIITTWYDNAGLGCLYLPALT
jgi:hypothetical protein